MVDPAGSGLRLRGLAAAASLLLLLIPSLASGQAVLKVSDTVSLKFGVLLQTQGDSLEDTASGDSAQNLFVRRARIIVGGQLAPNATFFLDTESPNIGKVVNGAKNNQASLFLQDAYMTYKFSDAVQVDAGLMMISASRNGLQSSASMLPLDYGPFTFSHSTAVQSPSGRDTGAQLRGYLLGNRLEYRAGVLQGNRDAKATNPLRTTLRLQYNVLDPETGFSYTGTYLGKKKVLAIGGGVDRQDDYQATSLDVFYDHPVNGKDAITAQVDLVHFDGGTFLPSLPKQNDRLVELGYYIDSLKISPVIQVAQRDRAGTNVGDETRMFAGVNYWRAGHTVNLKAGVTTIRAKGTAAQHQYTVQLQFYYF